MSDSGLSPLKRAFLKIEEMQAKLDSLERARREPIAVLGMGCRFPGGAGSPDAFWRLLREGVDAVGEIPKDRWDIEAYYDPDPQAPGKMTTRWGAFLESVEGFDAQFFGISPREALSLDPQQRLLLEVAWEALENAGIAPDKLSGSRTGVFVALCKSDYLNLQLQRDDPARFDVYYASGNAYSVASGRLSYVLGLQGPSITVDTACSASLVALHLACQSLRIGESRMALVGGANLILSPENTITFSKSAMMAADGRCKTFDASADGFVQGEGCGVVVLKRLCDARADGDRILALVRGTAVNQDGPSSGLTAPNGPAQEAVVREALASGGVQPSEVSYIEAHGTGTSLGDPIEVQALGAVLCPGRPKDHTVALASVKTNLGHLEGAAGIAGFIKVVLSLQHQAIPAHLHFKTPSPHIPWADLPFAVPTRLTPWNPPGGARLAGLSSFGFSGTNAHVVLEEAPTPETAPAEASRPRHVLCLSAKGRDALRELARRFEAHLAEATGLDLADVCHTANAGRAHLDQRLAAVADSLPRLRERLSAYVEGREVPGVLSGELSGPDRPKIAFLFTGQGAQYVGMGRRLYQTQPIFRSALERCEEVLRPLLPQPLLRVIYAEPGQSSLLNETAFTQPALFAIEYALLELWRSWGIVPSAVMGHSVGEYVAACAAGVFSLEEGLRLIAERGRLMQALPERGAMAVVFASEECAASELAAAPRLAIAAVNGPENVVISGAETAVDAVLSRLEGHGVKSRRLSVSHAFHSPLMEPMLDAFEKAAATVALRAPRLPLISNLTGQPVRDEIATPGYWRRHAREAVRFSSSMHALSARGYDLFLELGPAPTLLGMGRRCLPDVAATWLPSLREGRDDWETLLESVAHLYLRGADPDWSAFDRGLACRRVALPTYPFQRKRYWFAGERSAPRPRAVAEASAHPMLERRLRSPLVQEVLFESTFSASSPSFVKDHRVFGLVVLPAAAYLEMAAAAAHELFGPGDHALEAVEIREALVLSEAEARTVQLVAKPEGADSASFQFVSFDPAEPSAFKPHATGWLRRDGASLGEVAHLDAVRSRCREACDGATHYRRFAERGLEFGPGFRGVQEIKRRDGEAIGRVLLPEVLSAEASGYLLHPALLDGCLQVVAAAIPEARAASGVYMPIALSRYQQRGVVGAELVSHAVVHNRDGAGGETLTADVRAFDAKGRVVAEVLGLQLKRVDQETLHRGRAEIIEDWLYEVRWPAKPLVPSTPAVSCAAELPSPSFVAEQANGHATRLCAEHGLDLYDRLMPRLDALSAAYILAALERLGLELRVGHRFTAAIGEDLGIVPAHRRLLLRMLEILAEDGWLLRRGSEWEVARVPPVDEAIRHRAGLAAEFPGGTAELTFTERAGEQLAGVLRGEADPLQVLFPGGSFALAEKLYEESPAARVFNGMAEEAISAVLGHLPPGRSLRVLEVGAGTGGTTSFVLSRFPADRTEYVFTDLSPLFLSHAEEKFRRYPFVRYQILDIEQDPLAQGFAPHGFDLIIAANVLHATPDLKRTLAHVRQLLAPAGMLLLLEGTRPQRWVDLTFGLTEGWWKFSDRELRPSYPLISQRAWLDVLAQAGFEEAVAMPGEAQATGALTYHALILGRAPRAVEAGGRWLLLADQGGIGEALATSLRARGEEAVLAFANRPQRVDGSRVDPARPEELRQLVADVSAAGRSLRGVVHLWALDAPPPSVSAGARVEAAQATSTGSVLHLVQALSRANASEAPRLFLVTRGAQPAGSKPEAVAVAQAPLWGLAKVIAIEHPELSCVRVDLDPEADSLAGLVEELYAADGEDQVAFRAGERRVARLARRAAPWSRAEAASRPVQLEIGTPGSLDGLELRPMRRRAPARGEVEIRVRATGLNFRDVLNALGMRRDDDPLGGECAGTIVAVGEGVGGLKLGDDVVAVTVGGFSAFVTAAASLVLPKPTRVSFEEGATLPLAFLTAHHALHNVGRMAKGERVLIHAAAGGVGMAAVQLAQRTGAEVFATAGSAEKRAFLESLGVRHVMDSRSLQFADEVCERTRGEGVDLVLNSLTGEFIPKGLSLLRRGGRFLEMGKAEIWDQVRVADVNPEARYFAIDLAGRVRSDPERVRPLFAEILRDVEAGTLQPLPRRVFALGDASSAFRYMAQAKHVGKVVVCPPLSPAADTLALRPDGTYFITGGLRGLGPLVARFLVARGARNLVLMGRNAPTPAALALVSELEATGTRVVVAKGDVSRAADVARALVEVGRSLPPLRGVIHSAGVLDDGVLLQQSWERFAKVMAPKVDGAWNLHALAQDPGLDFFVLFSSTSALIGSPGQANHAAANAFLDALAHRRRALGLPALSINWGVWSDVGAAAERNVAEHLKGTGVRAFSPEQGLSVLERLLAPGAEALVQVAVMPIVWSIFLRQSGRGQTSPLYSDLARGLRPTPRPHGAEPQAAAGVRERLEEAPPNQRHKLLLAHVREQAITVLGIDAGEAIDPRQPLNELGLDSLMAVELRNLLGAGLGLSLSLPSTLVFDYPSIGALTDYLASEVLSLGTAPKDARAQPGEADVVDQIEDLSDEEVERLLSRKMTGGEMSEFLERISKLSPKRLALLALELNEKVEALERSRREPIAVVGLGCRFPGAEGPEAFWRLLRDGVDATSEVPRDRWDVDAFYDPDPDAPGKMSTRRGGFLGMVDRFDPQFFGVSPREALSMDPQQRLLLEVTWEALEHAGQSPEKLHGSRTGVFIGICSRDYVSDLMAGGDPGDLDTYLSTGGAHSVASGRISYVLGLHGPSISLDTACSSSLVAVHLACQSLRSGGCHTALAGGVNLILSPDISIMLSKAHMMAPDGRCKTFDAAADGFARGEGCGIVVLKRLADALAEGDRVLAVICGSAVNQDGRSSGVTAPNGPAQEDVIREALADAGLIPDQVQYVETHGTGTSLGDPIEVQALGKVLGSGRSRPVGLGSVKTNFGHLEAAAGVAGLIKLVLSLQHQEIPSHLHFKTPSPHIPWGRLPVEVVSQCRPWPASDERRIAGVSSFGFSGTNAHVLLEGPPDPAPRRDGPDRPLHLLALSARTEEALRALAGAYERHFEERPQAPLGDVAFTAGAGRSHFARRAAVLAGTSDKARDKLRGWLSGEPGADVFAGQARGALDVAFLFTGQGAQYVGMGRQLFETQPVFREALSRCDELLRPRLETPLLAVLYPKPGEASPLDETAYTQPALFALEYALAQLWRSWGIEPAVMMGHSVGEYVAACLAGVFSLEDGLRLIAERARLMQALPRDGEMAAVMAGEERVAAALAPHVARVSIAAVNGPDSVVVSGARDAVARVLSELETDGIKSSRLTVSHAFHSPLMEPMLQAFEAVARSVSFAAPAIGLVSNVTGKLAVPGDVSRPEYWVRHVRETVCFSSGMRTLAEKGYRAFLEIGPSPTLLGMGRRCVANEDCAWFPSLRPSRDDWSVVLESLAKLYVLGAEVDWSGFDQGYSRRRVGLPTYPFQRERYWHPSVGRRKAGASPSDVEWPAAHPSDEWLYEVAWRPRPLAGKGTGLPAASLVAAAAAQALPRLAAENDLTAYDPLMPQLDTLCAAYFMKALGQLGWEPRPGDRVSIVALAERLGVAPGYHRLLGRMLSVLEEEGVLSRAGSEWEVRRALSLVDTESAFKELMARFPAARAELAVAGRCGEGMADVIRGQADPLQLLFPGGSFDMAEKLYQEAPAARTFGGLVREAVARAVAEWPSRLLRVLEIGAGTGSTTSFVLPVLPAGRTDYVFTDVSRAFIAHAQEKFRSHPFLRYQLLDIEKEPPGQGFALGSFDIVLAANVLHATQDLRRTLAHVRLLLAPGGLLVLQEATEPHRFADVTVGLTEGWWRFSDLDLRPAYALLSRSDWKELLGRCGFAEAVAVPDGDAANGITAQQVVMVARADGATATSGKEAGAMSVAGRWLILADQGGVGEALAVALRSRGGTAVCVGHGSAYGETPDGRVTVDPARPEHFQRLLSQVGTDALRSIVYLWALDAPDTEALDTTRLDEAQSVVSRAVLSLVQALAPARPPDFAGLWLVTRGAQGSVNGATPVTVAQSPLLGLGKVIALEHPELRCVRVDLDPAEAGAEAERLLAELTEGDGEDQIALRSADRLAPRLVRCAPAKNGEIAFRADATYLITGGLGGLGLEVARWMVECSARHLVLMARSTPSAAAMQTIRALEGMGARVLALRGDVSREADVATVLSEAGGSMPPLRGVIHSAGVLADGVLQQQDWERFARVMAPKVQGGWNLHRQTSGLPLDFFVLFSSGAALFGSPGQANHAAANAFLDSLAHHRRCLGLPALSVNWGVWGEIGTAADRKLQHRLTLHGMPAMTPRDGLAALGRVMTHPVAQVGVLAIDWTRIGEHLSTVRPFFSEIASARPGTASPSTAPSAKPAPGPGLRQRLEEAPPSKRWNLLHGYVSGEAVKVLGLDPSKPIEVDRPLQEMGLDSLMAVELRNALGRSLDAALPATLLFDHPTFEKLIDYVGREVLRLDLRARNEEAVPVSPGADGALEGLLPEQIAALLSDKLDILDRSEKR